MARKFKSFVGKTPIIIGLVVVVFVSLFMNIAKNIEGVEPQSAESQQRQQDQNVAAEFANIVISLLKDELNKTTYDNMTKQQIIDNINSVLMTQVQDTVKQKFKTVVRQDKVNAVMKNIDLIFPKIKEYASPIIISNITAIIDKENFTNLENFIEGATNKQAEAAAKARAQAAAKAKADADAKAYADAKAQAAAAKAKADAEAAARAQAEAIKAKADADAPPAKATTPIKKLRASDFSKLNQDISNEIIKRTPEFINTYQTQMINNLKES